MVDPWLINGKGHPMAFGQRLDGGHPRGWAPSSFLIHFLREGRIVTSSIAQGAPGLIYVHIVSRDRKADRDRRIPTRKHSRADGRLEILPPSVASQVAPGPMSKMRSGNAATAAPAAKRRLFMSTLVELVMEFLKRRNKQCSQRRIGDFDRIINKRDRGVIGRKNAASLYQSTKAPGRRS